jgi:hypothetical protein
MQLRVAEQYIEQFGRLAREGNTFVVPANLSDIGCIIAMATGIAMRAGDGTGLSSPGPQHGG